MAVNCEKVVSDLFAAWTRLDLDGIMSYFAEDGVWDNVPMSPSSAKKLMMPSRSRRVQAAKRSLTIFSQLTAMTVLLCVCCSIMGVLRWDYYDNRRRFKGPWDRAVAAGFPRTACDNGASTWVSRQDVVNAGCNRRHVKRGRGMMTPAWTQPPFAASLSKPFRCKYDSLSTFS